MNWKWTDETRAVAMIDLGDGVTRSASIAAPDLAEFIAQGGQVAEPEPIAEVEPVASPIADLAAALVAKGVLTKGDVPASVTALQVATGVVQLKDG